MNTLLDMCLPEIKISPYKHVCPFIAMVFNHSKSPSANDTVGTVSYRLGELNGRHFSFWNRGAGAGALVSSEALFLVCSLSLAIWFLEGWGKKTSCLFSFYVLTFIGFCVRGTYMPVVFVKRSEDSMKLDFSPSTLWDQAQVIGLSGISTCWAI